MAMDEFGGIVLGSLGFIAILLAVTAWRVMAAITFAIAILDVYFQVDLGIRFEDMPVVLPADILFCVVGAAALIRLAIAPRTNGLVLGWLAFSCYLLLCFARGAASFGAVDAAVGYRQFFYYSIGTLYFSTFVYGPAQARSAIRLIHSAVAILLVMTLIAWIWPNAFPKTVDAVQAYYQFDEYRVVPASAAMFMGVGFLLCIPAWLDSRSPVLLRAFSIALLLAVVLLYHRTVWVAMFVALAVLTTLMRRRAVMLVIIIVSAFLALGIVWLLLAGMGFDPISAPMESAISEATQENSSMSWRAEGWRILVGRAIQEGPWTVLFGAGFGVGFERRMGWEVINFSPHNMYVELFLTSGLIGTAAYLALFLQLVMRLKTVAADAMADLADGQTLVGVVAAIVVYGITYGHRYDICVVIGVMLSLAAYRRESLAPVQVGQVAEVQSP
jgi:O-antigen ligase